MEQVAALFCKRVYETFNGGCKGFNAVLLSVREHDDDLTGFSSKPGQFWCDQEELGASIDILGYTPSPQMTFIERFMCSSAWSAERHTPVLVHHPVSIHRGTGMIASSSTFCPHPGRVIRDLFRQLNAVWHGTEAL